MSPMLPDNIIASLEIERTLTILIIVLLAIVVIYLLSLLANYIMSSIALTHIGRRRGIKQPWLVWIPIARNWAIGAIADEYDARNGLRRRFRVVLLVFVLAYYALQLIFEGSLLSIVASLEELENGDFLELFPIVIKTVMGAYTGIAITMFASLVFSAIYCVCLYKIYESLSPKHCVLHLALSIVVPLYQPICLLCLRKSGHPYADEAPALPEHEIIEKGWYEA